MAKKFFSKALSVGLSLALCAGLAAPAFAASYTELQGAINAGESVFQDDGTTYKIEASKDENGAVNVKLHEDVERGEDEFYINIAKGENVTIDLNGHDIVDETTQTVAAQKANNIVVQGTLSVEGEGTIKSDNTYVITNFSENSTLNLNGGTIEATGETGTAIYTKGTTTISEDAVVKGGNDKTDNKTYGMGVYAAGGTVNTSGDVSGYVGIYAANGTVNVEGGNVESESSYGIFAASGNVTNITGGNVTGETQGVHIVNGGKVTVNGEDVTITGKKEVGIGVYGGSDKSELTVEQGTIQGGSYGIAGNGLYHGTDITVAGGTVAGGFSGIYHPQDGVLTIGTEGSDKGPTIIGTNGNGVQVCAGEATIYGGTIKGSGVDSTEGKTGDGVIPDGSAVSAVSRKGYGKVENRTAAGYSQPKVTIHVDHVNMDPNGSTFQWSNSAVPGQKPADWDGDSENSGIIEVNHAVIIDPYVAPTYTSIGWTEGSHCDVCGVIVPQQPIPMLAAPEDPSDVEIEDSGDIEIEDPDVPLAGLFTRGDAIGYLWEQSGSPEAELSTFEDVPEDHQWAVAIGWAQDMGIARADEEGNFRPDDLVLRGVENLETDPEGELQEFLNWYAQYAGVEQDENELFIKLEGALDDVIMGEEAQVIFDDFFAKLEAALAAMAA